jgi:photosystem II stability/assembly factor-like uncharacterized protein
MKRIFILLFFVFFQYGISKAAIWQVLQINDSVQIMGIHSYDGLTVMAVGYNGFIARSTNGGQAWAPTSFGEKIWFNSIFFASAKTVYASYFRSDLVSEYWGIYKSENSGLNWTKTYSDAQGQYMCSLGGMCFLNENVGFICTQPSNNSLEKGAILKTTNGGYSWNKVGSDLLGYFTCIKFISGTTGFAVGSEGIIYKTINAGSTWQKQYSYTSEFLTGIDFVDNNNGFAVGKYGTILKTTNGGTTWTRVTNSFTSTFFRDIRFIADGRGYIAGDYLLLSSENKGETWQVSFTPSIQVWDMCLMDNYTCFISGSKGTILKAVGYPGIVLNGTNEGFSVRTNYKFESKRYFIDLMGRKLSKQIANQPLFQKQNKQAKKYLLVK